jgi:hypothetical protein
VLLSDEAYRAMRDFTERHGVSMSAFVESIGILMADEAKVSEHTAAQEIRSLVIGQARATDASRRVRTK